MFCEPIFKIAETVYLPGLEYVCFTLIPFAVVPSPKSQEILEIDANEVAENENSST